ncbi:nuclease PA3 [Pleomassaria siparia CBS 279.74]|uniref:Nuclease PA3 n=1 Tax=Pleomassaria siparia CBS 279.74 TaxID=1314801 RepID=A0A6G1KL43_9PLEO|nr:nuclease PA3 [Pleomassaria siparia CBS 279.74]
MTMKQLLIGSLFAASAVAWNAEVHNQIGFMAETFLTPKTTAILQQILEPKYNGSIGKAAAWADAYAHTPEGRFSYQWHWIDTEDNPPTLCHLNYAQDCAKGGCVVSAIANQTEILKGCIKHVKSGSLTGGTNLTCSYALKWISHFTGDIAQPLHASGRAVGGNTFRAIFGNVSTELHAVWDGYIPYADANVTKTFSNQTIEPFFASLVTRILQDKKDDFLESPEKWLACSDPSTPKLCATRWAQESNKWDCEYVYKNVNSTTDLATSGYAVGAFPIIEMQISKAALRLGTWLNKMAVGNAYDLEDEDEQMEL